MSNYKYESGKYYRKSSNGNWFEVERNKDGHLTWTQPDGQKVYDNTFRVPLVMWSSSSPLGTVYTVPTGANGSVNHYYSLEEAAKAYTKALESGSFSDPSENILNDLVFDAIMGIRAGKGAVALTTRGVKALTKVAPKAIRTMVNTGRKLLTGQVSKEAVKSATKQAVKRGIKEVPKITASVAGGDAVNRGSKALTGKTWGENVAEVFTNRYGFRISPTVGEFTNPGYGYGYFVGNNFSNLGRYTLDNLRPWQYAFNKEQLLGLAKTYTQPFYKSAPTFYTHRPKWYTHRQSKFGEKDPYLDARFENGANWANIPESEVPRKYFVKNADGTISPTSINTESYNTALLPDKSDFSHVGETIIEQDHLTPGKVGGEHSDFTYLGDDLMGNSAFEYTDVQKLNPQWQISDWIKKKYNLQEGSRVYNAIHKLGGIDLSQLLGYKPFTIRTGYVITPSNKFVQIDPDYAKRVIGNP